MNTNKLFEFKLDSLPKNYHLLIAGDIHGDLISFQRLCTLFNPNKNYMIFLGDYADRGQNGIEVILGVHKLIKKYPEKVIALKGNHEDYTKNGKPKFMPCDLVSEVNRKKGNWETFFKRKLKPFISKLFLAAILPGEVLFLHGGVSKKIRNIDDLKTPSSLIEKDVLWSDPVGENGEYPSIRGAGIMFGKDISEIICHRLNVKRIVRSHQPGKARNKPYSEHEGRMITLSSTIVYGGSPFVLDLPIKELDRSFESLEKHVTYLRKL
jgi:hypothetical protein